jgi:K+-transporting ATPase KdpF subunit
LPRTSSRRAADRAKSRDMAIYVLALLLIGLIAYLFYAVIHPERF